MNEQEKRGGKSVVAGCDTSELLAPAIDLIDQFAAMVELLIDRMVSESVGTRQADLLGNGDQEGFQVVPHFGYDKLDRPILNIRRSQFDAANRSASRTADSLLVKSMGTRSISALCRSTIAMRPQIPFLRRFRKCKYMRHNWPGASGRARHGLVVHITHRTASVNRRLPLGPCRPVRSSCLEITV